jgi:hypothetical protein
MGPCSDEHGNYAASLLTSEEGDSFTVERLMPVPYKLTLKLDIWTSNTEQKLQLIEQLCTVFNPSLELQSTDNYIDWSSLSYVTLTEVSWDSRTVPINGEDPISVATLTFELPMWISPPAKLKKLGIIDKLISSWGDGTGLNPTGRTNGGAALVGTSNTTYADAVGDPDRALTRRAWNVMRYGILYTGNTMQLIKYDETIGASPDPNNPTDTIHRSGTPDSWNGILSLYGSIKPGLSEIRIEQPNGLEIIGTIALHPADDTLMLFEPFIDTLPGNTLKPINLIVDPFKINVDKMLIDKQTGAYKVEAGTRFLITNPINSQDNTDWAIAWSPNGQHFAAHANDIIEYDGAHWRVSFDSQLSIEDEYVTNLNTNVQYHWDGEGWTKSYEGHYREGKWTLVI